MGTRRSKNRERTGTSYPLLHTRRRHPRAPPSLRAAPPSGALGRMAKEDKEAKAAKKNQSLPTALGGSGCVQGRDDARRCIEGRWQRSYPAGDNLHKHLRFIEARCDGALTDGIRIAWFDRADRRVDLDPEHTVGDARHDAVVSQFTGVNLPVEETAKLVIGEAHAFTGSASDASLMKAPSEIQAFPWASTSAQSRMKPSRPRSVNG